MLPISWPDKLERLRYGWILGQALMEEGNCRAAAVDEGGGNHIESALAEARAKDYRSLELRALGLLGGHAANLGNQVAAWQQITSRLAAYWQAPYRGTRGQQFYYYLRTASAGSGHKFSAFVFQRAAAEEISKTPLRVLEAQTRAILASFADAADLASEAEREFSKAERAFRRLSANGDFATEALRGASRAIRISTED